MHPFRAKSARTAGADSAAGAGAASDDDGDGDAGEARLGLQRVAAISIAGLMEAMCGRIVDSMCVESVLDVHEQSSCCCHFPASVCVHVCVDDKVIYLCTADLMAKAGTPCAFELQTPPHWRGKSQVP